MNTASPTPYVCGALSRVVDVRAICREHVSIEVALSGFPPSHPGQFLQLLCHEERESRTLVHEWSLGRAPRLSSEEWFGHQAYLRRPFSIADRWEQDGEWTRLMVISRKVGPATAWLERLRPGDTLNLSGPFGRGFTIPDPRVPLVLAGGGVGIPPLLYLARVLSESQKHDVTMILGATTRELLPVPVVAEPARDGQVTRCVELAGAVRPAAIVTTDDGTMGLHGYVTDGLRHWHKTRRERGKRPLVLACGPQAMLHAVAQLTRELEMDCQLCIEKPMGCGLGTCLSCIVRVRDASGPAGWRWALVCCEGPVFERDALIEFQEPVAAGSPRPA